VTCIFAAADDASGNITLEEYMALLSYKMILGINTTISCGLDTIDKRMNFLIPILLNFHIRILLERILWRSDWISM
jgi:hypothetical protein